MSSPRVITLCPGLVERIEECWKPCEFRAVIKSAKNAFKSLEHLAVVLVRIDLVIENQPCSDLNPSLQEIRDEVEEFLERNSHQSETKTHFRSHKKQLRILNGKKSLNSDADKEEVEIFTANNDLIEKNLTLQVFKETGRDKEETARRLGISLGRLIQRLITYGEELSHGRV